MSTFKSPNLNLLANLIFEKTGLAQSVSAIKEKIEDDISGAYARNDEDPKDLSSYPSYAGVVYESYQVIKDGELSSELKRKLSESQKNLLKRFIPDETLTISVVRTDFEQEWSFDLQIPIVFNDPESELIEIQFNVKVSLNSPYNTVEAHTDDELNEDDVLQLLTMYSLQI